MTLMGSTAREPVSPKEAPSESSPTAAPARPRRGDSDEPWASFCVATYRRPARLATTLCAIAAQTMGDFEVVVSDNDPAGSAGPVVEALGDTRFRYFRNRENLGMVKNFNAALSHARGTFVTMMADDDPPLPHMLATLRSLSEQHPSYGAYYGACEVFFESEDLATARRVPARTIEGLADRPRGAIRTFSAAEFPLAFLTDRVLPILWSAGIVRRDIALAVGGLPNDGAIFVNDLAYVALAGAHSGCATVNLPLARYTYHSDSLHLEGAHQMWAARRIREKYWQELKHGIDGCHGYLSAGWSGRPDWHLIRPRMERWLARRCHGYLLGTYALKHGGAGPTMLEALSARMTVMRFALAVPHLRDARSLWSAIHDWWLTPLVQAGRRRGSHACGAMWRLWSRVRRCEP